MLYHRYTIIEHGTEGRQKNTQRPIHQIDD